MTDASSDSDESAGRAQEWEVVSLSTLSMSGSGAGVCSCEACTSALQDAGSGRSGEGAEGPLPQAKIMSDHFGSAPSHMSPMMDQFLGSVGTECMGRTGVEEGHLRIDSPLEKDADDNSNIENSPNQVEGQNAGIEESNQTVHHGKKENDEGVSEATFLPEMDWIEPVPPSANNLLGDGSDAASNSSLVYDMASEKKLAPESDYMPSQKSLAVEPDYSGVSAGPLLGSCSPAPSASAIVSSVAAFRAGLGLDIVHRPIGVEDCSMGSRCVVEEELAGLEREILGTDAEFKSFHEAPVLSKKLGLDDSHSTLTDAFLSDPGENHSSCEAWWKRRAVQWFVEARQANTLWSLALAAAVMGLVILGQRWQHERCQNQHLRLQLCSKDEKISQLIFQVARLKDALSGRRRVPVQRTTSSYSTFRDRF